MIKLKFFYYKLLVSWYLLLGYEYNPAIPDKDGGWSFSLSKEKKLTRGEAILTLRKEVIFRGQHHNLIQLTCPYWIQLIFTRGYWEYLLHKPDYNKLTWGTFWCRLRGHPDGPIYFNPGGTEPNMRCSTCDDFLG